MKVYRCPECQKDIQVVRNTVRKRWIVRGYKYEYWGYFIRCPHCGTEKETTFFKLPLRIMIEFLLEK